MLNRYILLMMTIIMLLTAACQSAEPPAAEAQPVEEPASATETRTLTDAGENEVELPTSPQRVVTLTELDLDSALAVGVTPVGSVNGRGQQTLPAYLADQTASVESVGSLAEPSLEKMLSLNPDLILVGSPIPAIEELLPQLQEIAPVFVTWKAGDDWQTAFRGVAAALNREAQAEEFMAGYQERTAAIAALLPDDSPTEASVTRWMPTGPIVMAPAHFSSLILSDVGLTRPAAHIDIAGSHGVHSDVISLEALDTIDSDWLFIGTLNAEGTAALDEAQSNPLYQQLEAVQQGQVATVDGTVWTSIGGPLAALTVLDDVEQALSGSQAVSGVFNDIAPDEESTPETRLVAHAMGETEVPANPQRVVVLDTGELDNTLALGVKPVGGAVADAQEYQEYLADQLDGITETGGVSEPNLEAIVALQPDLILGSKQRHEAVYEQLSAIAPTVFVESLRVPWQDNFRLHAEALGRTAEAEQMLAEYNDHVAETRSALGDQAETTVSIIRFRPGQVRLYLKNSFIGYILQDVGLPRPPSQAVDDFATEISLEQIAAVDAGYIFLTGYNTDDSELATFLGSQLWTTLNAVKADRVSPVNDDTWISGLGIQAAHHVLDDLPAYLVE